VSPALEAMNGFIRWLAPTVEKFPRSQKFLLGDRIQATALDVLERLIEATYTRVRQAQLRSANLGVEKLRHFFRIAVDLRFVDREFGDAISNAASSSSHHRTGHGPPHAHRRPRPGRPRSP